MHALPIQFYEEVEDHQPFKLMLFTRLHELKHAVRELDALARKPKAELQAWLAETENELRVHQYLYELGSSGSLELDTSNLDSETSTLLIEYTQLLQELLRIVQTLFAQKSTPTIV